MDKGEFLFHLAVPVVMITLIMAMGYWATVLAKSIIG